jgi:polyhydroxyalkanoate synthesis regulator phasin
MTRTQPRIKLSLLLGTIIALGVFSIAINNIPVQALHKEEQKLDKFDNLKEFADAVKNDDAKIDKIPLLSMKASKIYDDADKQTQDCINLAAKIGKTLVSKEVVHCVDDVNFYKNQISNSSVPTTATSTTTSTSAVNGTDGTTTSDVKSTSGSGDVKSTSGSGDVKSTSGSGDVKSTSGSGDVKSTSGDVKENNMINELVSTGKFTEAEAKDFVSKTMGNGADGASTSDNTQSTSSQDNNANTQSTGSQDNNANTQSTSSQDNNANTQSTSSQDNNNANTQSTSSQDNNNANTQSSNNQDNNNPPSNENSNQAIDYNDLKDLVHSIKNHVVDSDDITLNAFQDSGAYKGADEATQKCIDLAGKIGNKLGDQEIVHCSEDPSFYQTQVASFNNNNANDNNANDNNANDNNANDNNANDNNANDNNANDNNNNPDGTSN